MKKLVIIGAGGHGEVIADIALENGYEEIVFLDDDTSITTCAGFQVVGKTAEAERFQNYDFIVAVGNTDIRRRIQNTLKGNIVSLVHPDAMLGRNVLIGKGTVVMAGVILNYGVTIGKGCIINTASSIDHDCVIGDYVHISVGAHLAGNVQVADSAWIGIGATISNNISICRNCMIGAGAVVVKNITRPGTWLGVPAVQIK